MTHLVYILLFLACAPMLLEASPALMKAASPPYSLQEHPEGRIVHDMDRLEYERLLLSTAFSSARNTLQADQLSSIYTERSKLLLPDPGTMRGSSGAVADDASAVRKGELSLSQLWQYHKLKKGRCFRHVHITTATSPRSLMLQSMPRTGLITPTGSRSSSHPPSRSPSRPPSPAGNKGIDLSSLIDSLSRTAMEVAADGIGSNRASRAATQDTQRLLKEWISHVNTVLSRQDASSLSVDIPFPQPIEERKNYFRPPRNTLHIYIAYYQTRLILNSIMASDKVTIYSYNWWKAEMNRGLRAAFPRADNLFPIPEDSIVSLLDALAAQSTPEEIARHHAAPTTSAEGRRAKDALTKLETKLASWKTSVRPRKELEAYARSINSELMCIIPGSYVDGLRATISDYLRIALTHLFDDITTYLNRLPMHKMVNGAAIKVVLTMMRTPAAFRDIIDISRESETMEEMAHKASCPAASTIDAHHRLRNNLLLWTETLVKNPSSPDFTYVRTPSFPKSRASPSSRLPRLSV